MASQQSIKVCCRVHGENEYNKETLEHGYSFLDSKSILHLSSGRIYTFDKIFDSCSSQSQIYSEVAKPIVFNVLSGYNGTILVYGHTSSDNAYTMEGVAFGNEKSGIIPRVAHDIFSHTESLEDSLKWEIKISFYEIYLEKVRDLFDDSEDTLQVYDDRKGSPFIVGGKEILVKNIREVMEFFNEAKLKRHVAYSDTNEMISRSHTIFQIVIKQENLVSHEKMTGKLLLVDLAGSEQVLTSVLTNDSIVNRESRCINMSLSVLSRVILLLTEKRDGIPYRESVLTRLLKESLGGNSQTAIIVCIRPSSEKRVKWSLEFGCRAKIIKNNFYLNVKHDRKKPSRIWEKFQRYICSTNQYISGYIAELQKWRSGKAVPAEEWIPFINCNENSFSDSYLTDTSLMDTSFIDTSDIVRSVHEQSNSQILSDSSFLDTFNLSLNESFTIPDYEDGNSLQSQIEIMKRQQLQSPHIECKPTESAIADDIEEQSNEEMLPFPHIECKPESEIADDIKEQSDEEMLPSPLIECKPTESAIVEDIKEQSDEEMLPFPHIECKPESEIADDIKEQSDEEMLPSPLIECKPTESAIVEDIKEQSDEEMLPFPHIECKPESEIADDIKEQSDEEMLPSPLIECKPTESAIVEDIKEQSDEEMLPSTLIECKRTESEIVDDIKEQSDEETLPSPLIECKPTESVIVDDIKEQSDEEMLPLPHIESKPESVIVDDIKEHSDEETLPSTLIECKRTESEIVDDIKEQSDEETLPSPLIECKPTESVIVDDIKEQSDEEMLPLPHIENKPESVIVDDIKEHSDEETLPSTLIECKRTESEIVDDIKEQSDEETLPSPLIECKPTESVIVDDIKEQSDEETLPSPLIECKPTESVIVDDIKEQSEEEMLPSPLIECKPTESAIVDDIKEQSEEEMLPSPLIECKPTESVIVDDIKEQSEEEMLQSPQTECKPTESAIVDDIKEQSEEEMLPSPLIECKPTESVIVDDIKEQSEEEMLPSPLIECKPTESVIVDDIKEQSEEEMLQSPQTECKPTESAIVDDIKEQSEEEMLQSPQTECKPTESAIVDDIKEQSEEEMLTESEIVEDIKEQSDEEMTELKEELEFHKKQTITLHQSLERVTQELKSQRDISDELSSALKMERKKNMLEEAHRKNYLQEINNFKEVRNNILELLARENAKNIDFQTLRSLKEIKPSHIEKLEPITVEDLKATLRAENMQNRISELSARFESLSESCLQRNRKHASRDSVNEKISLLQAEIVSLEKNQGTNEQTLNERIAEKIQKVNVEGFNELLLDDSIQSCDLKSRGHYIHLSQKYDQQKQKTAEVIAERDAAKESLISLEKEVRNLSERHDTEKQALNAEIDKMSRDIERLNLELRKELYIKCEHNSNLDGLKKEVKDASKTVRILSDKICVLENDLDMERNRSKEDTARMEIILLEKANTINVLVTRLCCLEQENRTLIEELQKTHYCKQMLQEESVNVLTILKNFSNRSHYEGESLCGNEMVNSEPMLLNEDHCDLVNANFNEISSFELSLRIKLVTELKRLFYECENIAALQGSPSSKNPDDSFDGKESLKDAIEYFQDCAESDSVLQNINIHEISTSELFLMSNSLEHVDSLETLPGVPLDYAESMEVANISEGITGNYQIEENVIITEQTGVEGHS